MKVDRPLPEHGWAYCWEALVRADNDAVYGSLCRMGRAVLWVKQIPGYKNGLLSTILFCRFPKTQGKPLTALRFYGLTFPPVFLGLFLASWLLFLVSGWTASEALLCTALYLPGVALASWLLSRFTSGGKLQTALIDSFWNRLIAP